LIVGQTTEAIREALRLGLRDHGYVEGKNILVEWRAAEGPNDRVSALAQELVRLKVDLIVATPTPAVRAAKNATSTIPIVMAPAGDPVGTGLVASLARPEGNITGVTTIATELGGKLLELIKEVRPAVSRVAVLVDANPFARPFQDQIQSAAGSVGVRIQPVVIRGAEGIDGAFEAMVKERAGAVIIQPLYATKHVADLAVKHRLISITTGITASTFPQLGGLMSYGSNPANTYRQATVFVDKLLKGAKPADLPVEQPTNFELVINRKTAKALGITIPRSMLLRTDRVIE
jgi:putative tryptophan/tyrosine transport system substrate-binding protein